MRKIPFSTERIRPVKIKLGMRLFLNDQALLIKPQGRKRRWILDIDYKHEQKQLDRAWRFLLHFARSKNALISITQ